MDRLTEKLTTEQANKLCNAISNAVQSGSCSYLRFGTLGENTAPGCVIAQLASLEGVTGLQLEDWFGSVYNVIDKKLSGYEVLLPYPLSVLADLQGMWDNGGINEDEGLRRNTMREYVREHEAVQ